MDETDVTIDGVRMSHEAARSVEECGVDVAGDVRRVRSGLASDALLAECLDGVEPGDTLRTESWTDYVDSVMVAAAAPEIELDAMIDAIGTGGDHVLGGNSAASIAAGWVDCGIAPAQARAYIAAGCWDADSVAELIEAGITPEHLADREVLEHVVASRDGRPVTDSSLAYAHSNGDLATKVIADAVVDVYDCAEYTWRTDAASGSVGATSLLDAVRRLVDDDEWPTAAHVADGAWGFVEAPDGERVTIGQIP